MNVRYYRVALERRTVYDGSVDSRSDSPAGLGGAGGASGLPPPIDPPLLDPFAIARIRAAVELLRAPTLPERAATALVRPRRERRSAARCPSRSRRSGKFERRAQRDDGLDALHPRAQQRQRLGLRRGARAGGGGARARARASSPPQSPRWLPREVLESHRSWRSRSAPTAAATVATRRWRRARAHAEEDARARGGGRRTRACACSVRPARSSRSAGGARAPCRAAGRRIGCGARRRRAPWRAAFDGGRASRAPPPRSAPTRAPRCRRATATRPRGWRRARAPPPGDRAPRRRREGGSGRGASRASRRRRRRGPGTATG